MLLVVTHLIALFKSFSIKLITYCINNHKIILTKITYKNFSKKTCLLIVHFYLNKKNDPKNNWNVFAFAQSGITNLTMEKQDQSTNQTSEAIQENVSDVVTNISKGAKSVGSNITTEIAKEVAENIGKKLQDLAK